MVDTIDYSGEWFLPDKPENRIIGTLHYSSEKGEELSLMGSLLTHKNLFSLERIEIIMGIVDGGKEVTLYKCVEFPVKMVSNGEIHSIVRCEYIFINAQFNSEEEIKFTNLYVSFTHLSEWVNISGFDIDFDFETKGQTIKYTLPKPIFIGSIGEINISIVFSYNGAPLGRNVTEAMIKQETHIHLESTNELPLRCFEDLRRSFESFLSLAVRHPVYSLEISGIIEDKESLDRESTGGKEVTIISHEWNYKKLHYEVKYYDMLLPYEIIENDIETYLDNWFKITEEIKPVYQNYCATLYNDKMYLEPEFRSLNTPFAPSSSSQ